MGLALIPKRQAMSQDEDAEILGSVLISQPAAEFHVRAVAAPKVGAEDHEMGQRGVNECQQPVVPRQGSNPVLGARQPVKDAQF